MTTHEEPTYLDSCLHALELDCFGLPHTILPHVSDVASVAVDTVAGMALDLLSPQARKDTDWVSSSILHQCARNDLHGIGNCLVRPLLHALNRLGQLAKTDRYSHLCSTTTGSQSGVENNVPSDRHGILQVPLNLVQDILRRSSQKNRAGLGVLAFGQEGEVFITNLLNLKEAAAGSDVGFLDIFDTVDDRGTSSTGDTVVVCLPDTSNGCHVVLDKEMLCQIYVLSVRSSK